MYTHHCAHSPDAHRRVQRAAQKLAGNGSVSISKAIRNKELEIIPISPSVKGSTAAHGSVPPHRDKSEPKVSISTVAAAAAARLSNGVPGGAAWREESASVSIEPCGPTPPMPPGPPGSGDDAPLNLSMKTAAIKAGEWVRVCGCGWVCRRCSVPKLSVCWQPIFLSFGSVSGFNFRLATFHHFVIIFINLFICQPFAMFCNAQK